MTEIKTPTIISVEIETIKGNKIRYKLTTDVGILTIDQLAALVNLSPEIIRKRASTHGFMWAGLLEPSRIVTGVKLSSRRKIKYDDIYIREETIEEKKAKIKRAEKDLLYKEVLKMYYKKSSGCEPASTGNGTIHLRTL